jgi:hypothetical protein
MVSTTEKVIETPTSAWFDDFVATLRSHQIQMEADVNASEIRKIYEPLIAGNIEQIAKMSKETAQKYFVLSIMNEYVTLLKEGVEKINKLAFDFNDSLVLIWAEINDDDEEMEKRLILTEAQVNAKYHNNGFDVTSTIVEQSDKLNIPNHYRIFKN